MKSLHAALWGFGLVLFVVGTLAEEVPLDRTQDLLTLDNGVFRVGIDLNKGATITWLSGAVYPNNLVNYTDPGRLIQQSYYAGKRLDRRSEGQHPAWSPWVWNPIQGGGVGSWATVTESKRVGDDTLYSETIPKLWDMADEEAEAVMRQWTAFEPGMPNVVVVKCELICKRQRGDRWGDAVVKHQEVPACYFTRNFESIQSYLGSGEWREEEHPPGPPWGKTDPPLRAMACFNSDGVGIGLFSPTSTSHWNFGPHRKEMSKDPTAGPCMHLAPISRVKLGPRSTYRYRYWLVLGLKTEVEKRLDQLLETHGQEQAELVEPPQ